MIDLIYSSVILVPIIFLSIFALSRIYSGLRPKLLISFTQYASLFCSVLSIALFVMVMINGEPREPVLGNSLWGFSFMLDALSTLMISLISVLGYFVLRFSFNYLDGDKRQGYFIGGIALTLACVTLLVISGHLLQLIIAWILTSLCLHKLLVFYKERPKSVFAANKKFIVARIGDISLIAAALVLFSYFKTGDLITIFSNAKDFLSIDSVPLEIQFAAILLVLAGALKSAQFPTQAWLIEVMETPTPVSALLHAGVLNAGIFLVIRFADIIVLSPSASFVLIIIGTLTALIASSVVSTQSSVKTSLAYSSSAQMGFKMLQCGLGAYPIAILHLVAHSFYKAHAFLAAGTLNHKNKVFNQTKKNSLSAWQGLFLSIAIISSFAFIPAVMLEIPVFENLRNFTLSFIFVLGLSLLISTLVKVDSKKQLIIKVSVLSFATLVTFFFLEKTGYLFFGNIFAYPQDSSSFKYLLILACAFAFLLVSWASNAIPNDYSSFFWNKIYVLFKNAFFTNTVFALITGDFSYKSKSKKTSVNKLSKLEASSATLKQLTKNQNIEINKAIQRIAPLWPLKDFVAVNPYHGIVDYSFKEAQILISEMAGSKLLMDINFYIKALEDGIISDCDIREAIRDENLEALSVEDFKSSLKEKTINTIDLKPIALITDLASELTGKDWSNIALQQISFWCSSYFDQNQALWTSPWKNNTLYEAWIKEARLDISPELLGLKGFTEFLESLPEDSSQLISLALSELGIEENQTERYCHRLLMSIGGWSAYARYFLWNAELQGRQDSKVQDLLAIRLVYELALYKFLNKDIKSLAQQWDINKKLFNKEEKTLDEKITFIKESIMQLAYEKAWQRKLFNQLFSKKQENETDRKKLQMIFCIDVRSELYRRNLENLNSGFQTIGFAGFFGFPIEFYKLGEANPDAQCPVLLAPSIRIKETTGDSDFTKLREIIEKRTIKQEVKTMWLKFKLSPISCFAYVGQIGFIGLFKLLRDSFPRLKRKVTNENLIPSLEVSEDNNLEFGLSLSKRSQIAEQALRAMSLTDNFAPFVLITGHVGSTTNNPHEASLACGACGGHSGESNAKVAAAVLNDREVRKYLKTKNINIPEDTIFLAALHNTTTDEITIFNQSIIPVERIQEFTAIKVEIDRASYNSRLERAPKLFLNNNLDLYQQVLSRTVDWSQVRPEWGLAGCSAFIAAPRTRTSGIDLEGKVFLHDYIWQQDEEFSVLNLIMTAPMIVASWISYQYYASVVDNKVFGSGNKVLHNLTGSIGVLEGNGGDLRSGLPMQSIHDGEKFVHEPRRLTVVIEAPIEAINKIIENNQNVRNLFDNGWLHLFAIKQDSDSLEKYCGNLTWIKTNIDLEKFNRVNQEIGGF